MKNKSILLAVLLGVVNTLIVSVLLPMLGLSTVLATIVAVVISVIVSLVIYYFIKYQNFLLSLTSLPVSLVISYLLNGYSKGLNPSFDFLTNGLITLIVIGVLDMLALDVANQVINKTNRFGVSGTPWK